MKVSAIWDTFLQAESPQVQEELRERLHHGGYSYFRELLHRLKQELAAAEEQGLEVIKRYVAVGRSIVPSPSRISPSFDRIWDDYDQWIAYKEEALRAIPQESRDGEWQIVMDNPYTNDPVSCYPALSFVEAAYLYAYFRKDLKPNEYVRLQKVTELLRFGGN